MNGQKEHALGYVSHIPDLMTWDDYEVSHNKKTIYPFSQLQFSFFLGQIQRA